MNYLKISGFWNKIVNLYCMLFNALFTRRIKDPEMAGFATGNTSNCRIDNNTKIAIKCVLVTKNNKCAIRFIRPPYCRAYHCNGSKQVWHSWQEKLGNPIPERFKRERENIVRDSASFEKLEEPISQI
jgi:Fe-S-cluster containining protein